MKIILASKSPRRKELLGEIVKDFDIMTAPTDETLPAGVHPSRGVELLAIRKGEPVAAENPDALVISSDTLVELDGEPLGKPHDASDAFNMLSRLSGRAHNVHTGVAVHFHGKVYSGVDSTAVRFKKMNDQEIREYIATGEPMDKAGAYGIQGLGGKFVEGYDGNYDTVVGLSVTLLRSLMEAAYDEA
ncbi:MAG: septum formation protein Maf [Clostridia bacterium]|nr:septum formation protein Maf [Clostridia bacterium]